MKALAELYEAEGVCGQLSARARRIAVSYGMQVKSRACGRITGIVRAITCGRCLGWSLGVAGQTRLRAHLAIFGGVWLDSDPRGLS